MCAVLRTWEAERIDKVLEGGRTKPFVAECVPTNDILEEKAVASERFVIKALGMPHIEPFSLFNELVGNLLARKLGIETPEPALIKITAEFSAASRKTLEMHGISLSAGTASGAMYLAGGLTPATSLMSVSDEVRDQITRIYAFDLVTQNPDRRPEKPNCAYVANRYIAYDFEMCFSFVFALALEDPCDFRRHGISSRHLFRNLLTKKTANWKPFLDSLRSLSVDDIDALTTSPPVEWGVFSARIAEHLRYMKSNTERIELELQRSLQ